MRGFLTGSLLILAIVGGAAGLGWWWLNAPMPLKTQVIDLAIEPGTSPRSVAQAAVDAGVQTSAQALFTWFRLSGQARQIKAGSYELTGGLSPRSLLSMLVRGDEALRTLTLVEGWSSRQMREALRKAEQLTPYSSGLEPDLIIEG